MRLFKVVLFVLVLFASSMAAFAQHSNSYPTKTIRLVVPFPAGGPTDQFARQYAQALSAQLGKPVIVDNKSGASGAIGSLEVKNSAPDGYTLLFGTASTHVLYNLINAKPQYDSIKDFTEIAVVGDAHVAVNPTPQRVLDHCNRCRLRLGALQEAAVAAERLLARVAARADERLVHEHERAVGQPRIRDGDPDIGGVDRHHVGAHIGVACGNLGGHLLELGQPPADEYERAA